MKIFSFQKVKPYKLLYHTIMHFTVFVIVVIPMDLGHCLNFTLQISFTTFFNDFLEVEVAPVFV